jgi:tRNA(fMet)-specific endonuclease VapC
MAGRTAGQTAARRIRNPESLAMRYLLDTNAWIEVLNNPKGSVATELSSHAPSEVGLCSVVLGELLVGAYKSSQVAANLALIHQLVRQFACVAFDESSAHPYAQIRSHLEKQGNSIGPYDLQIAAIALQHGLTVVTHNIAEFSRVPGMIVEDWLQP